MDVGGTAWLARFSVIAGDHIFREWSTWLFARKQEVFCGKNFFSEIPNFSFHILQRDWLVSATVQKAVSIRSTFIREIYIFLWMIVLRARRPYLVSVHLVSYWTWTWLVLPEEPPAFVINTVANCRFDCRKVKSVLTIAKADFPVLGRSTSAQKNVLLGTVRTSSAEIGFLIDKCWSRLVPIQKRRSRAQKEW